MKKIISLVLTLVLAVTMLSLAGCGSSGGGSEEGKEEAQKFIIATDTVFAPFEFTDDNGDFVGIDVDILAAVAEDQGFEYDLQSLGFDAALAAVESGQADGMIAGMSITDERKEIYDFSDEYYDSTVCAACKADANYTSLDDIKGQSVVVKTGTQSAAWAEEIKDEYELKLVYKDDSALMYQEVLSGNAAACFEDFPVMAYGVQQGNGLKLLVENQESFATPYGFAVKKGENAELLEKFNAGLKNIKDNGKYQEILDKYTSAE
ncbi:MAG: transporter substrate-binding domain-containing protein [Lachnospiraceae bacterium]|nr:transporter substrate-binding domain-containing protein [Lachnospiraceae bacterium]